MSHVGWVFRTRKGRWVDYYYVRISDEGEAERMVGQEIGDTGDIEGRHRMSAELADFLSIDEGKMRRGHLVD
jgi:hypothetical protein